MPSTFQLRLASLGCAVIALLAGGPGQARGDRRSAVERTLRDEAHRYQIAIATGWRPLEAPAGTLVAYAADGGRAHLAITRVEVGTRGARDPAPLAAEVERGIERATRGFRRRRRKLSTSAPVPTLDLRYERAAASGRELVLSRFLFFNRFTMVLSIGLGDGAGRAERRAAEAMLRSFAPFP